MAKEMTRNMALNSARKMVAVVVFALLFIVVAISSAQAEPAAPSSKSAPVLGRLASEQREDRLLHARELMGSRYQKSIVRSGEEALKINNMIYRWTRRSLPSKFRDQSHQIAQAIIDVAHKYSFDPVFILSVIKTESSFNPERVGTVGELGLMQVRPETGEWMAKRAGVKWKGSKTLRDPIQNIRIGASYLSYVRERFDSHARLYLAAYNMGPRNVNELRAQSIWPSDYPARVMEVYVGHYTQLKDHLAMR